MKRTIVIGIMIATVLTACSSGKKVQFNNHKTIKLVEQGRYHANIFDRSAAEIVTYDKSTQQTFVVNAQSGKVDIIDSHDIKHPIFVSSLDVKRDIKKHLAAEAGSVNSVDVHNGLLAVAIEGAVKTDLGWVAFYNSHDLRFISAHVVGALPDMVTFTANGKQLIVAVEGEPSDKNYAVDPQGEVAIIDIDWRAPKLVSVVTRLNFSAFNNEQPRHAELPKQLVLNGYQASVAQDLEPEYIAVNRGATKAYVSLQENNALAVIDLKTKSIEKIMAFGFKDHLQTGNGFDGNNKDHKVNIENEPALGLYQPDSIAIVTISHKDYLITANEGDDRSDWISDLSQSECEAGNFYYNLEDKVCADDLKLKDAFNSHVYNPIKASAKLDFSQFQDDGIYKDAVRQVKFSHSVTKKFGDINRDGKIDRMMTFGGRSFSIWDVGNELLVFDSGSDFENITAQKYGNKFNQSHNKGKKEDRSDNKGPEPEALSCALINGNTYAFIGLERMGGIMVYDISEPKHARFIQYLNNRNLKINPKDNKKKNEQGVVTYSVDAGDLGPEGMKFVMAKDSPTKSPVLIVGNEVSGTTTFYRID